MEELEPIAPHPEELTLLDYMVGELPADSSDEVRRHIRGCAECRARITALSLAIDEIDRLPLTPIPHDALAPAAPARRRGAVARAIPIALLLAAALGILALFEVGGLRSAAAPLDDHRLVVRTSDPDPAAALGRALAGVPHRVVVDRDDERHVIVLVADGDVPLAAGRLASIEAPDGDAYVVEIGEFGPQLEDAAP